MNNEQIKILSDSAITIADVIGRHPLEIVHDILCPLGYSVSETIKLYMKCRDYMLQIQKDIPWIIK
jgi:hypothetical protein